MPELWKKGLFEIDRAGRVTVATVPDAFLATSEKTLFSCASGLLCPAASPTTTPTHTTVDTVIQCLKQATPFDGRPWLEAIRQRERPYLISD